MKQPDDYIGKTQDWIKNIVIGLNFCPFAKPVLASQSIRYAVSQADDTETLAHDFVLELQKLIETPAIETSLLIHPFALQVFDDYLDFLDLANDILEEENLIGNIQIASFHPHYCFAGVDVDDRSNFTNRSPYPMLHFLRESSISQASKKMQNTEQIFEENIKTLSRMTDEEFELVKKNSIS